MKALFWVLGIVQTVLAYRVFSRMARSANGKRIAPDISSSGSPSTVSVLVPVLDEAERLGPCLARVAHQDELVREILVIDGGSTDETRFLIARAEREYGRIRFVDAAPVPVAINGKAYGLMRGAAAVSTESVWLLTIDADVRLAPGAVAAIVSFAEREQVRALSVASSQRIHGTGLGLLHPSMLATLVYRFGIPGHATSQIEEVQANGQCFLIAQELLKEMGGFESVLDSICEDVTLARSIANAGEPVGFFEAGDLVEVEMHRDAADAWRNWPRSLALQDRFVTRAAKLGMAEILLVQGAPLWMLAGGLATGKWRHPLVQLQGGLMTARLGVLAGTARAYPNRPWTYWLSPLADLPVILEIVRRSRQRSHVWRGRRIVAGERR